MRWVEEDCAALARLLEAAHRWNEEPVARCPGGLIRKLRRAMQLSQLELARVAGVPRSLVGRVESGGDVQLSSLRRLFGAFGCGLVMLPASEPLLGTLKAKAREQRLRDREWEEECRRLDEEKNPTASLRRVPDDPEV